MLDASHSQRSGNRRMYWRKFSTPSRKDTTNRSWHKVQKEWKTGDAKAWTWIELVIRDAEMIHISGATTAWEMWKQLIMVKESRGCLGVLATCQALYRATANESFKMVDDISKLQKLQEELHIMGSPVPDEDYGMILITLIPEAWNNYTSAYLGSSRNKLELWSHEIIAILLNEDQRCKGQSGTWHYKQKKKTNMKRGRMMVTKRNVKIAKRRDILQRIVGQMLEAWKGKGWTGTDQIKLKKEILA